LTGFGGRFVASVIPVIATGLFRQPAIHGRRHALEAAVRSRYAA
jgi:hypothetical protein